MTTIITMAVAVLTLLGIFGVVTLALNLQYGYAGMINFGVVAYFAAGAYAYAILTVGPPGINSLDAYRWGFNLPVWAAMIGAGLAAVLLALLTGWPSLRLRGEYLALTTFAFAEVFNAFLINVPALSNGPSGFSGLERPFVDLISFDYRYFLLIIVLLYLGVTYFILERIVQSPYGRILNALKDNELGVITSGKSVRGFRLEVFLLTALFTGVAGAFYVWYLSLVRPNGFTADITFLVWIGLILGGEGNNKRALLGIGFMLLVEEMVSIIPFTTVRAAQIAGSVQTIAIGLLFIAVLRWKPFDRLTRSSRLGDSI